MINWWEAETLAQFKTQERLDEAQRRRLIREVRDASAYRTAFLARMVAWLKVHAFTRTRRQQGQSCAGSRIEESASVRPGGLIL